MNMRLWLTALCLSLFVNATANALSFGVNRSYSEVTPGGKFIFVMIADSTLEEELSHWNEETQAKIRKVRATYSKSGMYRNDGSTDPLWTIDGYMWTPKLASDGIHMVTTGMAFYSSNQPIEEQLDQTAVTFWARGKEIRSYTIRELSTDPRKYSRTISTFGWLQSSEFNHDTNEYILTTMDGNRYVFDLATGEIVSKQRTAKLWIAGFLITMTSAIFLGCLLVWMRRMKVRSNALN